MTSEFYLADVGGLLRADVEENIDLLRGRMGSAFSGDAGTVVAILLQELTNILQGTVQFVDRVQFAELELRGIHDLVIAGMPRSAFDVDDTDKEVERSIEGEDYIRS